MASYHLQSLDFHLALILPPNSWPQSNCLLTVFWKLCRYQVPDAEKVQEWVHDLLLLVPPSSRVSLHEQHHGFVDLFKKKPSSCPHLSSIFMTSSCRIDPLSLSGIHLCLHCCPHIPVTIWSLLKTESHLLTVYPYPCSPPHSLLSQSSMIL